jgi:hypothetical protein
MGVAVGRYAVRRFERRLSAKPSVQGFLRCGVLCLVSARAQAWSTHRVVEITLWEFGAATFCNCIRVDNRLSELVSLSDSLWDNA